MLSETPSYQPHRNMIATTLIMIIATHRIERQAWMMFRVATRRTTKAKEIAMAIPDTADFTNAASEGIQPQTKPPV